MRQIVKNPNGFSEDCGYMVLVWDITGKYLGQWQDDMIGNEAQRLFIGPDPTGLCCKFGDYPELDLERQKENKLLQTGRRRFWVAAAITIAALLIAVSNCLDLIGWDAHRKTYEHERVRSKLALVEQSVNRGSGFPSEGEAKVVRSMMELVCVHVSISDTCGNGWQYVFIHRATILDVFPDFIKFALFDYSTYAMLDGISGKDSKSKIHFKPIKYAFCAIACLFNGISWGIYGRNETYVCLLGCGISSVFEVKLHGDLKTGIVVNQISYNHDIISGNPWPLDGSQSLISFIQGAVLEGSDSNQSKREEYQKTLKQPIWTFQLRAPPLGKSLFVLGLLCGVASFILFLIHHWLTLPMYAAGIALIIGGSHLTSLDCRSENIRVMPVIISELELSDIEVKVLFADLVEGANAAALDQRPKTFNCLSVDRADNVLLFAVVNRLVGVFLPEPLAANLTDEEMT